MTYITGFLREHKPVTAQISCACGCGESIHVALYKSRQARFVNGHQARVQDHETWTKVMVDALVSMWGKHPTKEIAAFIGVTKNAVIGRAGRMGLRNLAKGSDGTRDRTPVILRPRLTNEEYRARQRKQGAARRAKKLALRIVVGNSAPDAKPKLARRVARPMVDLEPSRQLHVSELTRDMCGFPTSTEPAPTHSGVAHKFCGHPAEPGKLFCKGHNYIGYHKSTVEAEEIAA